MDSRARSLLEKLLHNGEKLGAGMRVRDASLTQSALTAYREERSLQAKEAFETTMRAVQAQGAVKITWDNQRDEDGFIKRVDLLNAKLLAEFLGQIPLEKLLAEAESRFEPFKNRFPALGEVIQRWAQLKKVRALDPDSVQDWLDAARVIEHTREAAIQMAISVPIREMSSRLFKDSKRIEKLTGPIDVLLSGSVGAEIRESAAVWLELGLFREEHPVRLAGNILVERDRVTAYLDAPYVGLPADTIKRLVNTPSMVMTIENQTTFHSEARKRWNEQILLLYTAGMPSPAWRAMYVRLLKEVPAEVPVFHWGDVDEGGFRIAARLSQDALTAGHIIRPWRMHPNDIPSDLRRKATTSTLERIRHFANAAGWPELGEAVEAAGFTVEQEGLL
jgi:Wadjet protein JetD, C-terminal